MPQRPQREGHARPGTLELGRASPEILRRRVPVTSKTWRWKWFAQRSRGRGRETVLCRFVTRATARNPSWATRIGSISMRDRQIGLQHAPLMMVRRAGCGQDRRPARGTTRWTTARRIVYTWAVAVEADSVAIASAQPVRPSVRFPSHRMLAVRCRGLPPGRRNANQILTSSFVEQCTRQLEPFSRARFC
jgi:hypothetical protein